MGDNTEGQEWVHCPACGNKTRLKLRKDTVLTHFPLFCPKCKKESLIDGVLVQGVKDKGDVKNTDSLQRAYELGKSIE